MLAILMHAEKALLTLVHLIIGFVHGGDMMPLLVMVLLLDDAELVSYVL